MPESETNPNRKSVIHERRERKGGWPHEFLRGGELGGTDGNRQGRLPFLPGELMVFFEETSIGPLLLEEGDQITRVRIAGLFEADQYRSVLVSDFPDFMYWRTSLDEVLRVYDNDEPGVVQMRSLGLVMHYVHQGVDDQIVIGEVEVGIETDGYQYNMYRTESILVDGTELAIGDVERFADVGEAGLLEFTSNMHVLIEMAKSPELIMEYSDGGGKDDSDESSNND